MADNTDINPGSGGDKVATDELNTLNGVSQSAPKPKAQRVKPGYGADGDFNDVSLANPWPTRPPQPVVVASTQVTWANSSAADTEKLIDLDFGSAVNPGRLLHVIVRNPSTVTIVKGLIKYEYVEPTTGTTRYADLSTEAGQSIFYVLKANDPVPSTDGQAFIIDGGLPNLGGRLSLKNMTALGGSDTFTASVLVTALCAA